MFSDGTGPGSEICCRQILFSRSVSLPDAVPQCASCCVICLASGAQPRAHLSARSPSSNRCLAYERISLSFLCQLYSLDRSIPFLSYCRSLTRPSPSFPLPLLQSSARQTSPPATTTMDPPSAIAPVCAPGCGQRLEEPLFRCYCGDPAWSVTSVTHRNLAASSTCAARGGGAASFGFGRM
ncbi:hypothetical protein PAHAL_3G298100 [Panicum hallii]|uniref:Uncharacterized protein n=1 Tax=Panicum hallii TaxID=206008 RepID=A0A2T8KJV9_9POAL|nr:hypothetical protein PAHAL_3G298100 [Panicum hallii]